MPRRCGRGRHRLGPRFTQTVGHFRASAGQSITRSKTLHTANENIPWIFPPWTGRWLRPPRPVGHSASSQPTTLSRGGRRRTGSEKRPQLAAPKGPPPCGAEWPRAKGRWAGWQGAVRGGRGGGVSQAGGPGSCDGPRPLQQHPFDSSSSSFEPHRLELQRWITMPRARFKWICCACYVFALYAKLDFKNRS